LERFHGNLELVDIIARQLTRKMGRRAEFDELRSLGQEGLLAAARRFDPEFGVAFRSFASYRVRGAMIDGVRKSAQLPRRVHEKLRCFEAAVQYAEGVALDQLGASPPGESRSDARRLLDEHLANMATAIAVGLISETAIGDDGERTNVAGGESPEHAAETAQLLQLLRAEVAELPAEEQELVRRHYFEGERFDHVAAELGLSKSWASRLHTRAVARLTKRLKQQV
jgi:RNA polymerase sigma factor for flagellar operon FliA